MTTFGELVDNHMVDVFTIMPGQVTSFDGARQMVSVQPCMQRKYTDSDATNLPIINDVPVVYMGAGDFWQTFDITVDSYVLLLFSMRSLEQWLEKGGIVDPLDSQMFDKSDAIAIAGLNPLPGVLSGGVQPNSIETRTRDRGTYLKLMDGTIELNGAADFAVAYNDLKTAFDQLKSDFNNLVTNFTSHVHAGVTVGAGSTGVTATPGVPSTADMSGAKVSTIRVP